MPTQQREPAHMAFQLISGGMLDQHSVMCHVSDRRCKMCVCEKGTLLNTVYVCNTFAMYVSQKKCC